jgi:hypothetical protein
MRPCRIFLPWHYYITMPYKKFPEKDNPKYQISQTEVDAG